jgi:hypothetical protein
MTAEPGAPASTARRACDLLALVGILTLAACSVVYMLQATVADHVEASVAAIALAWGNGQPLYHALEAPEWYSLLYGPITFGFNRLCHALTGEPLLAGKVGAAFSLALGFMLIHRVARRSLGPRETLQLTGYAATFMLVFGDRPLGARGDAPLFALGALAIAALPDNLTTVRERYIRSAVIGMAVGLASGIKLQAGIYFLPVLAALATGPGALAAVSCAATAGIVTLAAPFLLLENVSLAHYVEWLVQASGHARSVRVGSHSILWLTLLFTPLGVTLALDPARGEVLARERAPLAGLVLGSVAVVFISAKVGAGWPHVLPMIPCAIWLWGRARPSFERAGSSRSLRIADRSLALGLVALLAFGLFKMGSMFGRTDHALALSARAELAEIMEREAGRSIAVGYGEPKSLSYLRVVPIAAGHPYLLDSITLMDSSLTGLRPGPETLALFESCAVDVWIQPAGAPPFTLSNYYAPEENVFGSDLPQVFEAHYRPEWSTEHLTVWHCAHSDSSDRLEGRPEAGGEVEALR